MKNSITKFDYTDIYRTYKTSDYFSKKLYHIYNMPEIEDVSFITYYQLTDNETIEQVSQKIYNTDMYWDIILYINRMDPLYSMVYNFDFSRTLAELAVDDMYSKHIATIKEYYNSLRKQDYITITTEMTQEDIILEQSNPDETIPVTHINILKDVKTQELESLKELRRTIKVIRPEKMSDFMRILRQQKII